MILTLLLALAPAQSGSAARDYDALLQRWRTAAAVEGTMRMRGYLDGQDGARPVAEVELEMAFARPASGRLDMHGSLLQGPSGQETESSYAASILGDGHILWGIHHRKRLKHPFGATLAAVGGEWPELEPLRAWAGVEDPPPTKVEVHPAKDGKGTVYAVERTHYLHEYTFAGDGSLLAATLTPRGPFAAQLPRFVIDGAGFHPLAEAGSKEYATPPPADYAVGDPAQDPRAARDPIPLRLRAADGTSIAAWYLPLRNAETPAAERPAVVLLHMNQSDKSAWRPLFPALRAQGIEALAIDMRGHGESTVGPAGEDLSRMVRGRDPKLYNQMWMDAAAAVAWLEGQGLRPAHLGLLGASVGCSAAIDAAHRDPELRVVGVLTPGSNYLGVPTLEHVRSWGDRRLLLVSSAEEWGNGAGPIADLVGPQPGSRVEQWKLDGHRIHGTRMFGKVPGIEERLAKWFAEALAPPAEGAR